jgi:predicted ATPase
LELRRLNQGVTQERRLREYGRFLDALSAQQGVVLWLEDLHWADRHTLALLTHLARSPRPSFLLVIGTSRPQAIYADNHPLQLLLSEARGNRLGAEIQLAPLTQNAVVKLTQSRLPNRADTLGESVYQVTRGQPLYVNAMIEHLSNSADTVPDEDNLAAYARNPAGWVVPESLLEIIKQQLDQVGPEARRVLEAASVAGAHFSAAAVAAALEMEVAQAEQRCEDMTQRHQFVSRTGMCEWPDGTLAAEYRFVHNLCHQTLYQGIPPHRRSQMLQLIGKRLDQAHQLRGEPLPGPSATDLPLGRDNHSANGENLATPWPYVNDAQDNIP